MPKSIKPILIALRDIKLAHSVFAMPFALLGAFVAATAGGVDWARLSGQLVLVVVCMFFARTWAMLVNRAADAKFDKDNPRTAGRAVAAGKLSPKAAWAVAFASAGAFWVTAALFWVFFGNPWPALLAPLALGWVALYAFTKRFTAFCHVFLGAALAISPICAAIAIEPSTLGGALAVSLGALALFITGWVAGFDVPYAMADIDFDRKAGLHSIPAKLGVNGALWVSRLLHTFGFAALAAFAAFAPGLGVLTWIGVGLVGGLLIYEHMVLAKRGVAGLPIAFFTVNGIISVVFGVLAIADTLV